MIKKKTLYFLINNEYHLNLDLKIINEISNKEIVLLQVPYALNYKSDRSRFKEVITFKKFSPSFKNLISGKLFLLQNRIKNRIKINHNDILFVHTDMDLTNQYIINLFYKKKAKIFLLEDGVATLTYYPKVKLKLIFKEKIRKYILKYVYDFKHTNILNFGPEILPILNDEIFAGALVTFGNIFKRKIPLITLKFQQNIGNEKEKVGSIFLSQPMYKWYCTKNEYIDFVDSVLAILSKLQPVYFKFHPSDDEEVINDIKKMILNHHKSIIILSDNVNSEELNICIKHAITINSTSAFNMIREGIIPVFLNKIFDKKYHSETFRDFSFFLCTINCKEPEYLNEITKDYNSIDFKSLSKSGVYINDII